MTVQDDNRQELADRLEALALKLKMHFEQAEDDHVSQALRNLRESVEGAFEATSNAVRDEAIRDDVREVGRLITDALATTVHQASKEVRGLFDRTPSDSA